MPVHDWSRVDAGIFHDFHQAWTIEIRNALNGGILPSGYFALAEQVIGGPIPGVVTLQRRKSPDPPSQNGGLAVAEKKPQALFITSAEIDRYAAKGNRISIKHRLGHVVAVVEIVSPGNKSSMHALRMFVEKAYELIKHGINLLIVDLLPPTARDPQGIHKAIWDEILEEPFALPADKRLTIAAYSAAEPTTAYVEPIAVGDLLPPLPIFLDPHIYVPAPLEETYQLTWSKCPGVLKEVVENNG